MLRIKTYVTREVQDIVKSCLPPNRKVSCDYTDDSSKVRDWGRHICVQTAFPTSMIKYQYCCGYWQLVIKLKGNDNCNDDDGYKYAHIARYVREKTKIDSNIKWENEDKCFIAKYNKVVESWDELKNGILYLYKAFDSLLSECANIFRPAKLVINYKQQIPLKTFDTNDEVCMKTMSIEELFMYNLTIPEYQRIYCWEEDNIRTLWENLQEMPQGIPYHLGAIIINQRGENCEIIDGQQRLVTLTIMLLALGYRGSMPLLLQSFKSKEAANNIRNAKYVIESLREENTKDSMSFLNKIISLLQFSVLILKSNNIDLAYTFFSNQNSRGIRLSDYDILKAHHLRFLMSNDKQAEHLARKWNLVSQERDTNGQTFIKTTLGIHLYRLRKWMRKHSCDFTNSSRPVKDEFSAALIIPDIPPFGEKFYFNEKIQGGSHFFAYTDSFVELYRRFERMPQIRILRDDLMSESHWKYESVIETILFGYFSKFGTQYFSEALYCVSSVIAQHRYLEKNARQYKINEYVQNSELVMMIDQASSPTFFLAETLPLIKKSGKDMNGGIRLRFYYNLKKVFDNLKQNSLLSGEELRLAHFTDAFIENKVIEEYD